MDNGAELPIIHVIHGLSRKKIRSFIYARAENIIRPTKKFPRAGGRADHEYKGGLFHRGAEELPGTPPQRRLWKPRPGGKVENRAWRNGFRGRKAPSEDELTGMREREMRTNEFRVVGPPGCGKTTWLGERVDDAVESGRRPLVTSLTISAAAEIGARKLPISFDCLGTLHSHCYHALGQPEIAEGRDHIEAWNEANPEWTLSLGIKDGAQAVDEVRGANSSSQGH